MKALDWLLEEDAPGVAYLARVRLLGESPDSRRVAALRRRAGEYPPAAAMLERVGEAIAAGDYAKYRGAYWTLIFLAEMRAQPGDSRLQRLARHVLERQLPSGGFAPDGDRFAASSESPPRGETFEIVCLTANLLRALVHCGFGDHPAVARGFARLAERILPAGGVPCRVIDQYSLLPTCRMTIPHVLRTLAVAPAAARTEGIARLRELLVSQLLEMRVYRYVRPDARRFYRELVPLAPKGRRPKGTSFAEFKAEHLRRHPVAPEEWEPKQGWLRFGFPHSYNPDLLQALLALAELGAPHHPALDEALDRVEAKRDAGGRWRLESSLNGKMLADVERKGRPSKWVTLHALTALRHFGRA